MKLAIALAMLAASSALAAYDNTWHQSEYWSGEYPNGFAVIKKGVVVTGRTGMDLDLARSVSCELPFKANYHPWNSKRKAEYRTASKIVAMVAKEDVTIGYEADQITVKAGETIEYLVYGAEGMFTVRYNGKDYEADQSLFEKVSYDQALLDLPQDEWLKIACKNGKIAWLFLRDLHQTDSEGNETYVPGIGNWMKGFREYGKATDLTDRDLKKKD
jgi:hypothetical protein